MSGRTTPTIDPERGVSTGSLKTISSQCPQFTGSYSYSGFRSCIAVNPWDTRNTAKAIHQALTLDEDEAYSRWDVSIVPHLHRRCHLQ
jgi:hypothetical protein